MQQRYISDPAMLAGRQNCDNSVTETWINQCQQYRTELSNSCGKVQAYLRSRGVI
jgi:hypothetical protein